MLLEIWVFTRFFEVEKGCFCSETLLFICKIRQNYFKRCMSFFGVRLNEHFNMTDWNNALITVDEDLFHWSNSLPSLVYRIPMYLNACTYRTENAQMTYFGHLMLGARYINNVYKLKSFKCFSWYKTGNIIKEWDVWIHLMHASHCSHSWLYYYAMSLSSLGNQNQWL